LTGISVAVGDWKCQGIGHFGFLIGFQKGLQRGLSSLLIQTRLRDIKQILFPASRFMFENCLQYGEFEPTCLTFCDIETRCEFQPVAYSASLILFTRMCVMDQGLTSKASKSKQEDANKPD